MAKGLKDAIERLVGNPAYDFGVAIVALFCGTALSQIVSTGQSFRVFPVCCWDPAQAQFTAASWFWSSLVVWVFFFWGQQHVSGIQRRAAEAAQIEERKFRDSQNAAQEERRKAEEEQRKFQAEQKALAEERRKAEEEIQQALRQQEEARSRYNKLKRPFPVMGFVISLRSGLMTYSGFCSQACSTNRTQQVFSSGFANF